MGLTSYYLVVVVVASDAKLEKVYNVLNGVVLSMEHTVPGNPYISKGGHIMYPYSGTRLPNLTHTCCKVSSGISYS